MASYPGSIASLTNPQGTNLLTSPDHGALHTSENNEIVAVESLLGTTAASNGLFNSYTSGQTPLSIQSGTIGSIISKGTINTSVFGTNQYTGGTLAGQIQNNGTLAGGVYGTAQWTGGTLAPSVISGSVIGSANILNGNVVEEKMRMNLLKGTILASGTTASVSLVGVVGGSVTINLPVASNAMIYFSAWTTPSGGGNPLYALYVDGTIDSTWIDTIGQYNPIQNSFTAWRTGYAAGNHTWQIQWRVAGGTVSLGAFELIVQPFSQ